MDTDSIIREQLLALLEGGNAHMGFKDAVSGFPMEDINRKVPNGNYTVWHLLEHMRIEIENVKYYPGSAKSRRGHNMEIATVTTA